MFFENLRKQMRWIIIVIVLAFVVTTVYVGVGQVTQTDSPPVVTVNGRDISYAQFQQLYASNVQTYRALFGAVQGQAAEELMYMSLRNLIEAELMYEAAEKEAPPVSDAEIAAALDELKASFDDEGAYRRALAQAGLTERRLRELIRDDLRVQKLQEQVRSLAQLDLTEEELAELDEESIAALQRQAEIDALRAWIDELWAQADIVIHDTRLRAHDLVRQGRLEEAVEAYKQALEENPFDAYLHLALGSVYEQLDRTDEALAEYETAVEMDESDPELRIILALAYLDAGRDEDAAAVLRETAQRFDSDAALQFSLAQLFTSMGLTDDAEAALERLAALQPQPASEQETEGTEVQPAEEERTEGQAAGEQTSGDEAVEETNG